MPILMQHDRVRGLVWLLETLGCSKSQRHLRHLLRVEAAAVKLNLGFKTRPVALMSKAEHRAYARLEVEALWSRKRLSRLMYRVHTFIKKSYLAGLETSAGGEASGDAVPEGPLATELPVLTEGEVADYFSVHCNQSE